MTTPASIPAGQDIQQLLDRAEKMLERIRSKIQELVDTINRTLASVPSILVPDEVVKAIQDGMRKVGEFFGKLAAKVQEFFNSPGWPPALFDAGDRWLSGVAVPSADTEEHVNTKHLNVDDYWKGSAANNYKATLGEQQPAFAAMVTLARKIKELLHTAGWAVIGFWVALVAALVVTVSGIVGAILLACGVVTLPASPAAAVGSIVGSLVTIGTAWWAATNQFHAISEAGSSLQEEARLNTSFAGDEWPKATAEGKWRAD